MIPLSLTHKQLAHTCLLDAFTLADLELLEAMTAQEGIGPLLELLLAVGMAWQQAQQAQQAQYEGGGCAWPAPMLNN